MARDPFSPPTPSGSGSKTPYVVAGLLAIALVTLAAGFYLPLHSAQALLAQSYASEGAEHAATKNQLKQTTEQLEATQKERTELASKVKSNDEAAAAKAERALDLHSQLKDKLAPQIKSKLLTLERAGDSSVLIIDDLRLFRGHEVAVHGPGKKVLCGVAHALKSVAAAHSVAVGSHSRLGVVDNPILKRTYATPWDVTAARASSAVQILQTCGFKAPDFSAVAYSNLQPSKEQNPKSSGELRIKIAPQD